MGELLNLAHLASFGRPGERNGNTSSAGSPCAADPVHEGLRFLRKVVIEDVCDSFHVQPAGSHIGCDQHLHLSRSETCHGVLAGFLAQIARKRFGGVAAQVELVDKLAGTHARAREDQRGSDIFHFEQACQHSQFVMFVCVIYNLLGSRDGDLLGLDGDCLRVAQVLAG